jgi:hypothetical protein
MFLFDGYEYTPICYINKTFINDWYITLDFSRPDRKKTSWGWAETSLAIQGCKKIGTIGQQVLGKVSVQ